MFENIYIPQYSNEDLSKVKKSIFVTRKTVYNNKVDAELLSFLINNSIYDGLSMKRLRLNEFKFDEKAFSHVSIAGSILKKVDFLNCNFNIFHSQGCKYFDVHFYSDNISELQYCDFSGSFFQNCNFQNINFNSASFLDCVFWECTFENCKFRSSTFENSIFNKCTINKSELINLNIEYASIRNSKISNSKISYFQLPYINGIFNCIEENNYIVANAQKQSIKKYYSNIEDSIIYFTSEEQYFPLINLYLFRQEKSLAKNAVYLGIERALLNMDIRTMGFYFVAGLFNDLITPTDIKQILNEIEQRLDNVSVNEEIIYNKILYSKLKQQVLYSHLFPKMEINIQTGYDSVDLDAVGTLCNEIDKKIESHDCKGIYRITHNSDPMLVVTIVGTSISALNLVWEVVKFYLEQKKTEKIINDTTITENKELQKTVIINYNMMTINPIIENQDATHE